MFARQRMPEVAPSDLLLSERTAQVKAWIEAMPAAQAKLFTPRKSSPPIDLMYKIMGKLFAVLSVRGVDVILKCEPKLASELREIYNGVGHRSYLDPRYWISIRLNSDVPPAEIQRLIALSYELVCAELTPKQYADLAQITDYH